MDSEMRMNSSAERDHLLAALRWQVDAGADEAILDAATDRFYEITKAATINSVSAPEPKPVAEASAGPAVAPVTLPTARTVPTLAAADSVNQDARTQANACANLPALREALASFDGCALKTTATNLVFGAGTPTADLMLIGEAPGRDEDRQGESFFGASGQLLDTMLKFVDLDRASNAYITNILPWRPPGDRQPTPAETAACLPFLERHITLIAPRALMFLGATSAKTLLGRNESITRLRGKWYDYTSPALEAAGLAPIPAMVTLHPAYLLRQPAQKRTAWRDLLAVCEKLDTLVAESND
jgi:uracil-DNA glycosylase family 4